MRLRLILAVLAMSLFGAATARAAEPTTADQLIAIDKAFSDYAAAHGTAEAYREYMDPTDSREFAGGKEPARGAAAIYLAQGGDKPSTGLLAWTPSEALPSASGDMGVTWGHWTYTPADKTRKPVTGLHVTVWRKDAAGHWKGLVDIGNPD
jgi:ketosteroid isomerase-like protein